MKDILGQEITVGCKVLIISRSGVHGIGNAVKEVKEMTPKRVKLETIDYFGESSLSMFNPDGLLVVDKILERKATKEDLALGYWIASSLEDPGTCNEMKTDVLNWFKSFDKYGD